MRIHYNNFMTLLTKSQLQTLDNQVFRDRGNVHKYYGYTWTKQDILKHLTLSEDEKQSDVNIIIGKSIKVLREYYGTLKNPRANFELERLTLRAQNENIL